MAAAPWTTRARPRCGTLPKRVRWPSRGQWEVHVIEIRVALRLLLCAITLSARHAVAVAEDVDPLSPATPADSTQIQTYLRGLSDEEHGYYAAMKLAELGSDAIPKVLEALRSPDPIIRQWAARTLTNMGPEKAASTGPAV